MTSPLLLLRNNTTTAILPFLIPIAVERSWTCQWPSSFIFGVDIASFFSSFLTHHCFYFPIYEASLFMIRPLPQELCVAHIRLPSFYRKSNSWHQAVSRSLTFDNGATESEARDPLLRNMRNCEWARSYRLIILALSALLSYPTTGRAGWGADVNLMARRNNTNSAAIRTLELETSLHRCICSARLKILA